MIRASFFNSLFMCESAFDVSKSELEAIIIMPEHILHISGIHISEDQVSINKLLAYAATLAYVKQITEQSRRLSPSWFDERKKKGSRRNGREEAKKW